jgi:organic hydroperoxide reductase OsmC/OhrA
VITTEGRPALSVSAPAEFRGESQAWSPEELFIASVETCFLSTFLAYAGQRQLPILAYRSHANGVLEHVDGQYRFTRIVLFPSITVADAGAEEDLHALLGETREHCLIANSIASIVEINPTIVIA